MVRTRPLAGVGFQVLRVLGPEQGFFKPLGALGGAEGSWFRGLKKASLSPCRTGALGFRGWPARKFYEGKPVESRAQAP